MNAPSTSASLRPRGSNHVGMRQYNERVVLQAIRLHGALPGAEIARVTQLTAQTVSLITKRLEADGLLAICIQHEMDHLLGKVFVQYLSPLKQNRIKTKLLKRQRGR